MKLRTAFYIAFAAILFSCTPTGNTVTDESADTLSADPDLDQATWDPVEEPAEGKAINIDYYWADAYRLGQQFAPFTAVYDEVSSVKRMRDSLDNAHGYKVTPDDSILVAPLVAKAYQAILQYGEDLKAGIKVAKGMSPVREGVLKPEDESFGYLIESQSHTLDKIPFAFLGGAPFIEQESELFKDASGNPETHYTLQLPENALYFFNYVYSRNPGPMELTYGPPLSTYEGLPIEVNGIGSITHVLKNRIPIWFLTTSGAVPAHLLSVKINLGEEYGCKSNNPAYVFACSKNISARDILGVFYTDSSLAMDKAFGEHGSDPSLWEFDIDGDGYADIVWVYGTFAGAASDQMVEAIWYVRINNNWVVLDYASEVDCT